MTNMLHFLAKFIIAFPDSMSHKKSYNNGYKIQYKEIEEKLRDRLNVME